MRAAAPRQHPGLQRSTGRRGAFGWAVRIVAVSLVMIVVIAAAGFAILLAGPAEIGLIRNQVVETLRDGLGEGYTVEAGGSVIDYDPLVGGVVMRVSDIVVKTDAGEAVANVPTTTFAVNLAKLLTLRLEVRSVEVSGAVVHFVRQADGNVELGTGTAAAIAPAPVSLFGTPGGFPDLIAPLQILDRGLEPPVYAAVRAGFARLGLVDTTIVVHDAATGRQRRFASSTLDVAVDPATSKLTANFGTTGFGGRWTASLERTLGGAAGGHSMTAVFSQLTIADLFPTLAGGGPIAADIPIYGRATINFGDNGQVETASARIDLGAGEVRYYSGREKFLLDEATVRLRWDLPNNAVIIDNSNFYFGETRGSLTGRVQALGDAANRTYSYSLVSPGAVLSLREAGLPPLLARQIKVAGVYNPRTRELGIDDASIITEEGTVAAVGSLGFQGNSTPSLALAASLSPMSADTLKRIWIPLIEPSARRWALENLNGGNIVSATLEAAVPPGKLFKIAPPKLEVGEIALEARFEDAVIRTLGDLPPISGAAGNVVLSGATFGIDLDAGYVETAAGTVNVDGGAFAIPDTSLRPGNGVVELQVSGSAAALAEIADGEPLRALSRRDMSPADLSGQATAHISVRVPLNPDVTEDDVEWKVRVETRGLASRVPFEGRTVTDADIALGITPGEVTVYGRALIDGVEADVSMAFPSTSTTATPGAQLVRLILDDEARRKLGVGLEDMLSGSITALVSDNEAGGQHYELDLERARLTIPGIGWTKGVGVPARMSLDITPFEGGHAVSNLVFQGDGFGFHGSATLDESFGLASADIVNFALREGDSVRVKVARSASGFAVNARGESVNLQGLMRQVRDRYEQSGNFPDLALDAKIDRLIGFNQEVITDAELRMVSLAGETQKLTFTGNLGDAPLTLEYGTGGDGTSIIGGTTAAGRLMRFMDLYRKMAGGTARLEGQGAPGQPVSGIFQISDFDVVDEPAMQRVVAEQNAALENGFNPQRVSFDTVLAAFSRDERAITMRDGLLRGPDVGATFNARYDIASANIVVTGTYLPAYGVNNLFGQIPLLGLALGGGGREGLFGVTFKVEGPIAQPTLYVNPLSAVAPGIFRKIFEFQ